MERRTRPEDPEHRAPQTHDQGHALEGEAFHRAPGEEEPQRQQDDSKADRVTRRDGGSDPGSIGPEQKRAERRDQGPVPRVRVRPPGVGEIPDHGRVKWRQDKPRDYELEKGCLVQGLSPR